MTKDQIFEFFRRLAEDNPSPETELEYGNAYQLVVAVALSAQATDVGVNKATKELFEIADTPEKMLALGEEGVIEHIIDLDLPGRPRSRGSALAPGIGSILECLARTGG